MDQKAQPIIIVGGNVVGLSAALSLAVQHVPTVVIEKHQAISQHPRAMGFTPRTMEIFRTFGVAHQIPQVPRDFELKRARVDSLNGEVHRDKPSRAPTDADSPPKEYSQFSGAAIPQDQLEAILEDAALRHGVDIRRGLTVVRIEQDATGVAVTATDAEGNISQLRSPYLIAADGSHSAIREQMNIRRQGRGPMQTMRSVLFRAALDAYTKGVLQFTIEQPDLKAFLTTYSDGRWVLMFYDDIDRDEQALLTEIHKAIGRDDVALAALIADRFQSGRIFIAGDAAHTLPPNRGGYGANAGIHDADNLAWKLASVLSGQSTPELLDTYELERRLIAQLRHDQIFVRSDYKIHLNEHAIPGQKLDNDAMEFGELYESRGFVGLSDDLPPAKKPDDWAGQPAVIGREHWSLVSENCEWKQVVGRVNQWSSVSLECLHIGGDIDISDTQVFRQAMGLSDKGASLIRPDGYIAWRTTDMPPEPSKIFYEVLSQVSFAKI
ncbi:uncharacterized protein BP01DRAFT_376983 [Aspergillus saccharolyticus JOP 1030-1]|uniref:FAD-binding domain-containing protein n=1 Tax=Aspergillus saccharolyticus JOP 1030-1 TaxID=1450539 RepID=A0A319A1Y8_9EURO|nr:hypothetical protein BP01DRAFT_376983 [Aspergillus saccharolyticus JOP 1030-1]PYH41512.1 hypothetical protein BP01DRAFT_376983 [Aspergillus saccharolyticus JOP 1030-1]